MVIFQANLQKTNKQTNVMTFKKKIKNESSQNMISPPSIRFPYGGTAPQTKLRMFCVLSQNHHSFEKQYKKLIYGIKLFCMF